MKQGIMSCLFFFLSSEDMFVITIDLPVGKNTYKYIVDGKWKEDPKQVKFVCYLLPDISHVMIHQM